MFTGIGHKWCVFQKSSLKSCNNNGELRESPYVCSTVKYDPSISQSLGNVVKKTYQKLNQPVYSLDI